jgi:hypothetical protein
MSVRKYVAMVNGEAVDLTAHLRPAASRISGDAHTNHMRGTTETNSTSTTNAPT